ncbi:MAG: hypothetical protein ACK58L_02705 [Planctomycetota bacterium]
MWRSDLICGCCLTIFVLSGVQGQETDPAPSERVIDRLQKDAAQVASLVRSPLAKDFLEATTMLKEPTVRVVYRNADKTKAMTSRAYDELPADQQKGWTAREFPPEFYFETAYGSPLVYTRLLDLLQPHWTSGQPRKLLDFGYGTIGHLQLLAHCGFDAHGVDVEPVFQPLYSEPGDTGAIGSGKVTIHTGQWPAIPELQKAIGDGYSVITSKNTLKSGYLHPSPPQGQTVDPSRLLHLGVSDQEFLEHVRSTLLPGGIFLIYNICPPQNPPDQPYLPWADGKSPFSRDDLERAGFEVLAFDVEDQAWVLDCFASLGYAEGKSREEFAKDYFCWYTIVRRPVEKLQ